MAYGQYITAGYVPIPLIPGDKLPAIRGWESYIPARAATFGETANIINHATTASWWRNMAGVGIGIACGSGVTVVDVDHDALIAPVCAVLPVTVACRGQKGVKLFYRGDARSEDFRTPERAALIQILGAGRQAVIPPSVHPETGAPYAWVNPWSGGEGVALDCVPWGQLPELPTLARWHLERIAVRHGAVDPLMRLAERLARPETDPATADHIAAHRQRYEAYAAAALRSEVAAVASCGRGGRNDQLFRSACNLVRFMVGGLLREDHVQAELWAACETNGYLADDGAGAFWKSYQSGVATGKHDQIAQLDILTPAEMFAGRPPEIPAEALPDVALVNAALDLMDLRGVRSSGKFYHKPSGAMWSAETVDRSLPKISGVRASGWIMANHAYNGQTWAPGEPNEIHDRYLVSGGWIEAPGAVILNSYIPPRTMVGDPAQAGPWLDLLKLVYPDEWREILMWFAFKVQFPGRKVNHALVLGGEPGIGKDTLLQPIVEAVGPWNVAEINPRQIMGDFNPWIESVILRINEANDLDESRYRVAEAMKTIIAAPPLALSVNQKNQPARLVPNVTGVIYTTNHRDAVYLKADDRRHLVCWSPISRNVEHDALCVSVWDWMNGGGVEHVAALLQTMDLSEFKPYAPPRKTEAFLFMMQSDENEVDAQIESVLAQMGSPAVFSLMALRTAAKGRTELESFMANSKNDRSLVRRLDRLGYLRLSNPDDKSGRWRAASNYHTMYVNKSTPKDESYKIARELIGRLNNKPHLKIVQT